MTTWYDHANCRGLGHLFFAPNPHKPKTGRTPTPGSTRNANGREEEETGGFTYDAARALCATCPVFYQCAEASINEGPGMWAGTTPRQRREIRNRITRRRRQTAA